MPLIVLVGIPCSGKTRISQALQAYFLSQNILTELINEESLGINKLQAYSSNFEEKNMRAALKSAVERSLNSSKVVILDSTNYIKGYRYELFCMVRQTKTSQCVIYLDITKEQAGRRNSEYPEALFTDLVNRMEVPNQKNKWDTPLIILREDEEIPFERIFEVIVNGRKLTENMATVKAPAVAQDYLYVVDQAIQRCMEGIVKGQEEYEEGAEFGVPGTERKFLFYKKVTVLQLKKVKQQFLKINKMHPCEVENCADTFMEYLNSACFSS